ncbi:MAG: hypothetical protein GKR89_35925 [Candidatus Latescibacteria bacterium]|nr:hypothetical protein [Candidatus Latescibacterota bacterium]
MIRITLIAQTPQETTLKIEGRLGGQAVELLAEEGAQYRGPKRRLILDLDGVSFIDQAGLDLLRDWRGPGLVLQGGSTFARMLMRAHRLIEEDLGAGPT